MTALSAVAALLRAQRVEAFVLPLVRRVEDGGELPRGWSLDVLIGDMNSASVDRAVAAYLLQRLPAANDGAPPSPRAA